MKLAISDPPYYGEGRLYADLHEHAAIWDDPQTHLDHMTELEDQYDGWVLATHGKGLRVLWGHAPKECRLGVWVKARRRNFVMSRVGWQHEFLIFRMPDARRGAAYGKAAEARMRPDVVLTNDTLFAASPRSGRILGQKPPAWTHWALALLDYQRDADEVHDLFPGSGAVSEAIATYPHDRCPRCRSVLPVKRRKDTVYCSNACRQSAHRMRRSV